MTVKICVLWREVSFLLMFPICIWGPLSLESWFTTNKGFWVLVCYALRSPCSSRYVCAEWQATMQPPADQPGLSRTSSFGHPPEAAWPVTEAAAECFPLWSALPGLPWEQTQSRVTSNRPSGSWSSPPGCRIAPSSQRGPMPSQINGILFRALGVKDLPSLGWPLVWSVISEHRAVHRDVWDVSCFGGWGITDAWSGGARQKAMVWMGIPCMV